MAREDYLDEPREAWTSKEVSSKEGKDISSQIDLEDGIKNKPKEALALEQPMRTKSSLVAKLMVIGKYLKASK